MKLTRIQLRKLILEAYAQSEINYFGSVSTLMSDPDLVNKLIQKKIPPRKWFGKNIGSRIGAGHSRTTYNIKGADDLVIKIAIGDPMFSDMAEQNELELHTSGVYGNKMEKKYFNTSEYFPKVYASAPDDSWIIHEKIVPINNDKMKRQVLVNVFNFIKKLELVFNKAGATEYTRWSGTGGEFLIIFDKFIGGSSDDELINSLEMALDFPDDLGIVQEALSALKNDKKLLELRNLVMQLGIDDIDGLGNIGTNKDLSKFFIIDIGLFPEY